MKTSEDFTARREKRREQITSMRKDGWDWPAIRKYFLMLDDWVGFNIAKNMEEEAI